MSLTIQTLTFLLGCGLVVVAIFGGGLEIKEVKIPTLPVFPRALSATFGCVLVGLALFRPELLATQNPQQKAPVDAANSSPTGVHTGPFDGRWEGTEAGWQISGTVANSIFVGNVDACVRRDNSRALNIARIHGQIYPDGNFLGETEPVSRPQEVRDISGHFPTVRFQARYPKEIGCDDVSITLKPSAR
jgi:hypothetical protein